MEPNEKRVIEGQVYDVELDCKHEFDYFNHGDVEFQESEKYYSLTEELLKLEGKRVRVTIEVIE